MLKNNSRLWKNHGAIIDKNGDLELVQEYAEMYKNTYFNWVHIIVQNSHHKCPINKRFSGVFFDIKFYENGSWDLIIKDVFKRVVDVIKIETENNTFYREFSLLGYRGQADNMTFESNGLKYILSTN